MQELSAFPGVTRRDFLKICGGLATLIGLGQAGAAEVAQALEAIAKRPNVIWSDFQECLGCSVNLLQSRTPEVATLILQQISLNYHEAVMAPAGDEAEKSFADTVAGGDFYWVAEGAIATEIPGAMTVHGKTSMDIAKETYAKAKATIAIGSCATYGGVQAALPNPTGAKGLAAFLKEDAGVADPVVINMSRCPGNAEDLLTVLTYVLVHRSCRRSTPSVARSSSTASSSTTTASAAPTSRTASTSRRSATSTAPTNGAGSRWGARVPSPTPHAPSRAGTATRAGASRWPVHRLLRAQVLGHDGAVLLADAEHRRARHRRRLRQTFTTILVGGDRGGDRRAPDRDRRHAPLRRGGPMDEPSRPPSGASAAAPAVTSRRLRRTHRPAKGVSDGEDQGGDRPDHPHRGAPARHLRGRERQGHRRLEHLHPLPRLRDLHEGPRPARDLALHDAHLRRLPHPPRLERGPRHRDGHGRRQDGRQHAPHPQHDGGEPDRLRPHPVVLHPQRVRLRQRAERAQRQPDDPDAEGRPGPAQSLRRLRAARLPRQHVLGPPRLQAAAGPRPGADRALPRSRSRCSRSPTTPAACSSAASTR